MAVIGYARISRREPDPQAQEAQLRAAGATEVFVDHGESSRRADRPAWAACLDHVQEGDTLIVRSLDRLAGTPSSAITTITALGERGVDIRSLTEPEIDTTTPPGQALFGIVAVFAKLRGEAISANTRAGLAHARAHGRVGGRPTVMTAQRIAQAATMRAEGQTLETIASALGVGRSSVSRALAKLDREQLRSAG